MAEEKKDQKPAKIEDVQVEPISDEDLEDVSGGLQKGVCSACGVTVCCTTFEE